jgi:hypothetical protein
MGKLFDSLKESIRSKLEQPAGRRRSAREKAASVGGTIEKDAEQAPPERVGEIVGHSSSG